MNIDAGIINTYWSCFKNGKTHEVGKRSMKKEHRIKKVFIRK